MASQFASRSSRLRSANQGVRQHRHASIKIKELEIPYLRQTCTCLCVLLVALCALFKPLDQAATEQVDAGLKRALTTYATARVIHAGISLAQSAQVGVGLSVAPGSALTPLAEMVQQFSDVMLVVCVSFGIQKLLLSLGGFWLLSAALVVSALAWGYFRLYAGGSPIWLSKVFLVLVLVRIAMPLATIGSEMLFQALLEKDYATSQEVIDRISAAKDLDLAPDAIGLSEAEPQGLWGRVTGALQRKVTAMKTPIAQLQNDIGKSVEKIVLLIAIFLVHTLILPLTLLWLLYLLGRTALMTQGGTQGARDHGVKASVRG